MPLRPYQEEAVSAIQAALSSGLHQSAVLVLPTGTGKTQVFSYLAHTNQTSRTLVVCPMRELIKQAARKLHEVTGAFPAIEQASNWSNEAHWGRSQFVVASKQTLCMKRGDKPPRYQRFQDVGLLIIDECDTAITPPQLEMISWFKERGAKVVGVTATPFRTDKKSLANAFDCCPYSMSLPHAIDDGWLVPPKTNVIRINSMDLSNVTSNGEDFTQVELNQVLEQERVELEMADVIAKESADLKTAVFCSSVAQAQKIAEILRFRYMLKADFVCADTNLCPDDHRSEILASFTQDGKDGVQILLNCQILCVGWDFPGLEHIVMARPTKSRRLYTQILGRGTRPLQGIVDFADSTAAARKLAISGSAKPHIKMTDLVDVSLKHRVCSVIDALSGEMIDPLRDQLQKEITDQGPVDVMQKLEELRQRIAREEEQKRLDEEAAKRRQQELFEAQRRKGVRANVDYDTVAVNLLESTGGIEPRKMHKGPTMVVGKKYKGQPLTTVPTGYIEWCLENMKLSPWIVRQMTQELDYRSKVKSA